MVERRGAARARANVTGLAGIFVPSSGIVDYAAVTRAMAAEFERMGGEIRYGAEVSNLEERRREVVVTTTKGEFTGRYLVTCSG